MYEKIFVGDKHATLCMSKDEYRRRIADEHDKYMVKIDILKNENKQLKEMNDYLITSLIEALNYMKNSD